MATFKLIIEGTLKLTFSQEVEADTALAALDIGIQKTKDMNSYQQSLGSLSDSESTKLIYSIKKVESVDENKEENK